jgi:formylglycine-generating enzyme required for sulfatase activity
MKRFHYLWFILLIFFISTAYRKKIKLPTLANAKEITKNLRKIKDSLYAWQTETSNYEYKLFLNSMKNKNPDDFNKYLLDTLNWNQDFRYQDPVFSMSQFYHKHVALNSFPVVNINYDNALAYCNWLTEIYNSDIKKRFKKVLFTLPTIVEWELAARGGRKNGDYPWGNYYVRNKKGKFLMNFTRVADTDIVMDSKTGNPIFIEDTTHLGKSNGYAFYTTDVRSYWPNDFGLYNCCGNVAEMVLESSVAKGGSWRRYSGDAKITAQFNYNNSSPEIGFRVFMKVLEM